MSKLKRLLQMLSGEGSRPGGGTGDDVRKDDVREEAVREEPVRSEAPLPTEAPDAPAAPAAAPEAAPMNLDISELAKLGGFAGSCLVDLETGIALAVEQRGALDIGSAGTANSAVLHSVLRSASGQGSDEDAEGADPVEDVLITLGKQFHLMRPLRRNPEIFLYLVLDRSEANLGMARMAMKSVEEQLDI